MIRVVLAEDMHILRGALVALLEEASDITVVADVADGDAILPAVRQHRPDVALVDIDLPGMDGLSAAAQVRDEVPECKLLILTSLDRPGTLRRALAARVNGYLLKDTPAGQLANAIRGVAAGQRVIDPALAFAVWESGECPLTPRELMVLRLTAEGDTAKEVASRLHLSVGTVRNYLTTVGTKLNARNRVDAVRIAQEAGWL